MLQPEMPFVRLATPDDEDDVFKIALSVHQENAPKDVNGMPFDFCEDAVRDKIRMSFAPKRSNDGVWIGIIGERGYPEGGVLLETCRPWYSANSKFLCEYFFHVLEPYRRSNNAKSLIAFAKSLSKQLNLPLIIGATSEQRVAAKIRLLERSIGKPNGAVFTYNSGSHACHAA